MKQHLLTSLTTLGLVLTALSSCTEQEVENTIRIGHAPNLTHVQALVARNMSRQGKGWFERYLPDYHIEWRLYTGGPTSMEAIFGKAVELSYVGPSPAINAYSVSSGQELSFLAGAVDGGASLLIAPQLSITKPADFKGKTIATPQLGNTQDITCRSWLQLNGLSNTLEGKGDVRISPSPSSMQAQLMTDGNIDASWAVEPWVSIIMAKTGAKLYIDQPHAVTTILVGRKAWVTKHPDLAQTMTRAHKELTQWIIEHPQEATDMLTDELSELTQTPQDQQLIEEALKRLTLNNEINYQQLEEFITRAQDLELLGDVPPLNTP